MDSLRVEWKLPELSDMVTMVVIIRVKTEAHTLRSQFGMGSESNCLLDSWREIWTFQIPLQAWKWRSQEVGVKEKKCEEKS